MSIGENTLFTEGFEGYFDQHKQRDKISTTPFARAPQLDSSEYVQLIANVHHIEGYKELQNHRANEHKKFYNQWMTELEQGFSVLLFGTGSKISLVDDFMANWNPPVPVVGVNAYNPATNFKDVLNTCVAALVEPDISDTWLRQPSERLLVFLEYIQIHDLHLALFINSIDGIALRDNKTQAFLARLVESPQISLLATVDHVNAPLLWSEELCARYNFVWHHTPTFTPYTVETSYMDILNLGQSRASVGVGAVKTVLASLTANAQGLYKLLTMYQYERMVESGIDDPNTMSVASNGIEMSEFFTLCVQKFVVSSEVNFRIMISEFKEHKMIEIVRAKSGDEVVFVPYSFDDIEQMISDF